MTLQSSGAISLSQIQAEFGGANPIGINEYYRGGSYVPSSRSTTTYEPGPTSSDWNYNIAQPDGLQTDDYDCRYTESTDLQEWIWAGNVKTDNYGQVSSTTAGGWTYYRGSFMESAQLKEGPQSHYEIRRQQTTTQSINTSIPTSGTISFDDFYGGTNS